MRPLNTTTITSLYYGGGVMVGMRLSGYKKIKWNIIENQ